MSRDLFTRMTGLGEGELKPAVLSGAYFFLVLCGYYILRPLREEMGVAGGVDNLPQLYLINLLVMLLAAPLFGLLATRFTRRVFIPAGYRFFMLNLAVFYGLMRWLPESADLALGRVFYVWVSVYNMWAVSLFWALMADGWGLDRGKRVFAFIATGGTLGAIVGSSITAGLVEPIGRVNLILISVVMLELAVRCVIWLMRVFDDRKGETVDTRGPLPPESRPGNAFSGITATFRSPYLLAISAYLFLYTLGSTFLYFVQARVIADAVSTRVQRAELFASIDLWVNCLTLALQLFLAGRIIRRIGVVGALILLPLLSAAGFLSLGWAPVLAVLVVFQVTRRAGNYALMRPARETLFTIVPTDQKYKAKTFIDTFVYRGGDAIGATVFDLLSRLGMGLAGIAFTAVPVALVWGATGWYLGRKQARMSSTERP